MEIWQFQSLEIQNFMFYPWACFINKPNGPSLYQQTFTNTLPYCFQPIRPKAQPSPPHPTFNNKTCGQTSHTFSPVFTLCVNKQHPPSPLSPTTPPQKLPNHTPPSHYLSQSLTKPYLTPNTPWQSQIPHKILWRQNWIEG